MTLLKKSPDALLIVTIVLVCFAALTWIVPAGSYDRAIVNDRSVVVPNTYKSVESNRQGLDDLLVAPIKGLEAAAHIIAFVLLVGGAFSMLTATGAIDAALLAVVAFAEKRPGRRKWLIPILVTFFSLAGCTFGMAEEVLIFILITLPLAKKLGYDPLIGIAIPFVGAAAGFAGAVINPFTVGLAQGLAELPIGSGAPFRWVVWVFFTLAAIIFISQYAKKLDKGMPSVYPFPADFKSEHVDRPDFNPQRILVVILFLLSIVLLMYGASNLGWYIDEISGLFLALGILSVIIVRMPMAKALGSFTQGARDMLTAALIIGISRSVLVVAEEGRIIDTLLHYLESGIGDLPKIASLEVMFMVQGLINIFIPSGSGQAAITMPIMTPLADLLGISRQSAVLAFQFGDGLLNIVIPTSGITMGILAIAKIPYDVWIRWIWKFILLLTALSMLFLAISVQWDVWDW